MGKFLKALEVNPKYAYAHLNLDKAFEEISGVDNLVEWARCNQTEFYRILARLMPREVEAKVSTQFTLLDALMEMEENLKDEKL